jgi:hypothetical protein
MTKVLMASDSTYFTDTSMRDRHPLLYEEYIGAFTSEEEKSRPFSEEMGLIDRIYHNIDEKLAHDKLMEAQEEQFNEEEEEEEEEEDESDAEESKSPTDGEELGTVLTVEELEQKRTELIEIMKERFLCGRDVTFILLFVHF